MPRSVNEENWDMLSSLWGCFACEIDCTFLETLNRVRNLTDYSLNCYQIRIIVSRVDLQN